MIYRQISLTNDGLDAALFERVSRVALRKLASLGPITAGDGFRLTLKKTAGMANGCYAVRPVEGGVTVCADSRLGFFSGVGRVMQEGTITEAGFEPGLFEGTFTPRTTGCGTYFATHFGNYYMKASYEALAETIEDLALWGCGLLAAWFDLNTYTGIDDPAAQPVIDRLRFIFSTAKELGMKVLLTSLANEGFSTTPDAVRAEWKVQGRYRSEPAAHYHVEVCPSKPGGMDLILENRRAVLERFSDIPIDTFSFGVYDQGGCTCGLCEPYGGNAYPNIVRRMLPLVRHYFPNAKLALNAWYLDKFVDGEWAMLYDRLDHDPELAAALDCTGGVNPNSFPADTPENASARERLLRGIGPGGTSLSGFPDISMQGCYPWGGFGANPYPMRLQKEWETAGCRQASVRSYSEGRFEDINKIIVIGLHSGRFATAREALRAYVRFELSAEYVDEITAVLEMMEETLDRVRVNGDGSGDWRTRSNPDPVRGYCYHFDDGANSVDQVRFVIAKPEKIEDIRRRTVALHDRLPERIRSGWRWQLIYLRALADSELAKADFHITEACEQYLDLLNALYLVGADTRYMICAPTRAIMRDHW